MALEKQFRQSFSSNRETRRHDEVTRPDMGSAELSLLNRFHVLSEVPSSDKEGFVSDQNKKLGPAHLISKQHQTLSGAQHSSFHHCLNKSPFLDGGKRPKFLSRSLKPVGTLSSDGPSSLNSDLKIFNLGHPNSEHVAFNQHLAERDVIFNRKGTKSEACFTQANSCPDRLRHYSGTYSSSYAKAVSSPGMVNHRERRRLRRVFNPKVRADFTVGRVRSWTEFTP